MNILSIRKKIIGKTPTNNNALDTKDFLISLKYLSTFYRSLNLVLMNCEIELDLSRSKDCIISEILRNPGIAVNQAANPPYCG